MGKSQTTAWSFNDDPRPPYEPGIMDMQDDIMTHLYADIEWLEKEVLHMKLVMTAARGEIEDQDYDAASAMMRYAIERPL